MGVSDRGNIRWKGGGEGQKVEGKKEARKWEGEKEGKEVKKKKGQMYN